MASRWSAGGKSAILLADPYFAKARRLELIAQIVLLLAAAYWLARSNFYRCAVTLSREDLASGCILIYSTCWYYRGCCCLLIASLSIVSGEFTTDGRRERPTLSREGISLAWLWFNCRVSFLSLWWLFWGVVCLCSCYVCCCYYDSITIERLMWLL